MRIDVEGLVVKIEYYPLCKHIFFYNLFKMNEHNLMLHDKRHANTATK